MIDRTISFYLQKVYNSTNNGESQIRVRIRWNGNVLQINSGFCYDSTKWDSKSLCKRNTSNSKGFGAAEINSELRKMEVQIQNIFRAFDVQGLVPTKEDIKKDYYKISGKAKSQPTENNLYKCFLEFLNEGALLHSWSDQTIQKFHTLKYHLNKFNANLKLSDFTQNFYPLFIESLLRENLCNVSINKQWKNLKWFLGWCSKKGYLKDESFKNFSPRLKTISGGEAVIFCDINELKAMSKLQFPEGKKYLERTRDIFLFLAFSGLRFSDAMNLKHEDIYDDSIHIVTNKTSETLHIKLNQFTRSILNKYEEEDTPLPHLSNQKMNTWIKEVGFLAGLTQDVTKPTFYGNRRIDITKPKYELLTSHAGRKSFICNSLSMGISPLLVMQITGHSDYKSMKPYVGQLSTAKNEVMKAFDLIDSEQLGKGSFYAVDKNKRI